MIVILSLLLLLVVAIIVFIIAQKGIGAIYADPIILGLVFFSIIHFLLPLMQINADFYRYQSSYYTITIFTSILIVFLGQLGFFLFFNLFKINYHLIFANVSVSDIEIKKILNANFLIFLIGAYFAYTNLAIILEVGVTEYLRDRISYGLGKGMEILLAHWSYISAFIFIFCFFLAQEKKIKKKALVLSFISIGVSMSYYILNSNRNSIFIMLLIIGGAWLVNSKMLNIKINKSQQKKILILLGMILVSIALFFNIGKKRYENYAKTHKEFEYSLVKSMNGAFGNHENILWLLENENEFLYGNTYLSGFTNFVPRKIWPNKPYGAGPILKNFIYPGSYVVGRAKNSSLTTGFHTELLMNFGAIGVIVLPSFLAIFLAVFMKKLSQSRHVILKIASFFTMISFFSQFYYGEFLGFFSRYLISFLPFIFIYAFVNIKYKIITNETDNTRP